MKTNMFTETDYRLAEFAKALSHPARVAIVRILMEKSRCPHGCDPCSCGDKCEEKNCRCGCKCGTLVEQFQMAQSTVSQHIKELKAAGLIELNSRKGDYTLNHKNLSEGLIALLGLLGQTNNNIMEENKKCNCGADCNCGENCNCGNGCECNCESGCNCGTECNCD